MEEDRRKDVSRNLTPIPIKIGEAGSILYAHQVAEPAAVAAAEAAAVAAANAAADAAASAAKSAATGVAGGTNCVVEYPDIKYYETHKELDPPGRPKEVATGLLCPKITDQVVEQPVPISVEKLVYETVFEDVEYEVEKIQEEVVYEDKILEREVIENIIIERPITQEKLVDVYKTYQRKIPAPMEVVCGWKFRVPKARAIARGVERYPCYVPRFVEVPVLSAYVSEEDFQKATTLYAMMQQLARTPTPTLGDISAVAQMAKDMQHLIWSNTGDAAVSALEAKLRKHIETRMSTSLPAVVAQQHMAGYR